jgi:hypothetical protein
VEAERGGGQAWGQGGGSGGQGTPNGGGGWVGGEEGEEFFPFNFFLGYF